MAAHRGVPSAAASSRARFGVASLAGRLAAAATRFVRTDGPTVRGQIIRRVDPGALARVVRRQPWVLVVGEFGTTVLAGLLLSAVRASHGSHQSLLIQTEAADGIDGVLAALTSRAEPELAVIAARPDDAVELLATGDLPRAIVLFDSSGAAPNTRYAQARALRTAIDRIEAVVPVIANAADPMIVLAAETARRKIWVLGDRRDHDQLLCPGCGSILLGLDESEPGWRCPRRDYRQPEPDYRVQGGKISDAEGQFWDPRLPIPGRLAIDQACFALATAGTLGIHAGTVFVGLRQTTEVLGRFGTLTLGETRARLFAARHPIEWTDALTMIDTGTVIIATDDTDVSWLWDSEPTALDGRTVIATGGRAADVTARLAHAGIDCRDVPDPAAAFAGHRGGVDVIALADSLRTVIDLSQRS